MTNDKWPNDLITRWHGWWGWLDDRELRRRLTVWYILHIISTWAWMWDDFRLVHDSTRKCDIPQQFTGVLDDPRILKIKAHLKSPFRQRHCDSDNELLDQDHHPMFHLWHVKCHYQYISNISIRGLKEHLPLQKYMKRNVADCGSKCEYFCCCCVTAIVLLCTTILICKIVLDI